MNVCGQFGYALWDGFMNRRRGASLSSCSGDHSAATVYRLVSPWML
jgi:hypothetical protein